MARCVRRHRQCRGGATFCAAATRCGHGRVDRGASRARCRRRLFVAAPHFGAARLFFGGDADFAAAVFWRRRRGRRVRRWRLWFRSRADPTLVGGPRATGHGDAEWERARSSSMHRTRSPAQRRGKRIRKGNATRFCRRVQTPPRARNGTTGTHAETPETCPAAATAVCAPMKMKSCAQK